jgi:predicted permease
MGRTLDAADELAGAPAVVVVSHEIWRTRLGGVADVVGRTIGIAGVPHVVVGVMPVGFHFPTREHLWTSMRDAPATGPADGRPLRMFGRLADGVTEEAAQLQADGLGRRMAEAHPGERANWRLEIARFGIGASGFPKRSLFAIPQLYVAELAALLLLLVACSNVAILVFARGAARLREIAVRTALGASRPRIVSQMFAESLILTLLATSLGLLASDVLFGRLIRAVIVSDGGVGVPYWMDLGVTPAVVAAALVLAALSAGFAGILPALRITRGDVHPTIQRVASGSGGIRFGTWTAALIALDVALAVVAVGFVTLMSNRLLDVARSERLVGVAADEYLAVQVDFAPDPSLPETDTLRARQRLETMERALVERLQGDPRVRAVAVASRLPRMEHAMSRIEVDGAPSPIESGEVHVVRADVGYFGAFETPILAGRGFDRGDLERGVRAAVVNTAFVDGTLGGANPLGRRIRFLAGAERDDGTWHEIVGVVGPLGINVFLPDGGEAVYLPAPPGSLQPLRLAIHVGAAPESFASTLREIVSEVDPLATTNTPRALSRVQSADWYLGLLVQGLVTLLVAVLLSLAVTGLYAVLSFAVSQRMREIGIRTALGAGRDAIALAIARRALLQIGLGALIGTPVVLWMFVSLRGYAGLESGVWTTLAALFPGILVVALVSLLACAAPVARALRVSPNEVLKTEG